MEIASGIIKALNILIKVLKDRESREKFSYILLIPIAILTLFAGTFTSLIAIPNDFLKEQMTEEEITNYQEFWDFKEEINITIPSFGYEDSDFFYDVNEDSNDYIKDKEILNNIVYYNQLDEPWKSTLYGNLKTIGKSGCGPTSMAIVISSFGQTYTPIEAARWAYNNGYLVEGYHEGIPYAMSSHALIPGLAKEKGLAYEGISKGTGIEKKIVDSLSQGKLIVAIMGPGHFTSGGHFIVLTGVSGDGKIIVADCASRKRSSMTWDLSLIIKEARTSAGAGGPFWAIGKN